MKRIIHALTMLSSLALLSHCGGSSSSSGSSPAATTRGLTGTVSVGSLVAPSVARGVQKATALACTDVKVCCVGYTGGTPTVAALSEGTGGNCSFTASLPLNSFCFCGLFSGADADNDSCPDTYLGSMGCSQNSFFAGQLPIFADADDSTDAIDGGTFTLSGREVTASSDLCDQVDQDNDGTSDADDTDADGDGILNTADQYNAADFSPLADRWDIDQDGTPDIFEDAWDTYADKDGDGVPNFLEEDIDGDGTVNTDDADDDGDNIADDTDTDDDADGVLDQYQTDSDSDGVPNLYDADIDGDGTINSDDTDDDGDNTLDATDTDDDGNGLDDSSETTDSDSDGVADTLDADDTDTGDNTDDDTDDSASECTTVSDCSLLFAQQAGDFVYTEAAISCTAGNCLYDCVEHNEAFSSGVETCTAAFEAATQTCTDNVCDAFTL